MRTRWGVRSESANIRCAARQAVLEYRLFFAPVPRYRVAQNWHRQPYRFSSMPEFSASIGAGSPGSLGSQKEGSDRTAIDFIDSPLKGCLTRQRNQRWVRRARRARITYWSPVCGFCYDATRAVSSAVRASGLHPEGPRFKSVIAHHLECHLRGQFIRTERRTRAQPRPIRTTKCLPAYSSRGLSSSCVA
jgi:hypothetical protein